MPRPSFLEPLQDLTPAATVEAASESPLGGAPSFGTIVGFSVQTQLQDFWCWAAISTSVAVYFGSREWTQCQVATAELGFDCCGSDAANPTRCNQPWYLDRPLSRVGHLDRMIHSTTPFAEVQNQVNGSRPLCCRIAWAGGGAHFVALGGWSAADGITYVDVHDPFYGFTQTAYARFVSGYRTPGDRWTHSYFTSAAAGGSALVAEAALPDSPKSA